MRNKIHDLRNHLFAELERLGDDFFFAPAPSAASPAA